MGLLGGLDLEEGGARERHQPAVAGLRLRQQRDGAVGLAHARAQRGLSEARREGEPHDRLHPGAGEGLGELERAEEVVGVGERERGRLVREAERLELVDPHRALEQRVRRAAPQMDEGGASHVRRLPRLRSAAQGF